MAKRRYKKKALPVRIGETATKERRRQNGGVATEIVDRSVDNKAIIKRQRAIAECKLDGYFLREVLSEQEYMVGMKFRRAYLRGVFGVPVHDFGAGSHGDCQMTPLTIIHSREELQQAYTVLSESEQSVIIAVCGCDEWAGGNYRLQNLRRGLEKLVRLWKIG